ncbi:MAG TPA: delta-60 repeat domain-containing protein [Polyangiaceae bacterium]|nr:delta-60 repeat domain-containing protein [Polyangiaceae bacterium]
MRLGRGALAAAVVASLGAASSLRCSSGNADTCDADCIDVVPAPLAVALTPAEVYAKIGDVPTVKVSLGRGPGGDGDVVMSVSGASGVSADPLTIAAKDTTGTLVLHVDPNAFPQGDATLTVNAQATSATASATLTLHVAGASGALDTSFGAGGVVDLTQGAGNDTASALVALQDTILVGGTRVTAGDAGASSSMMLARLAATNGALDNTFGSGGFTSAPGELASIAPLSDGRVFAVGDLRETKASIAAYRFLASGALDPSYTVVTSLSGGDDLARSGAVQPGGQLVVAGSAGDAGALALARYTQSPPLPDAAPDAVSDSASYSASDSASDADSDSASEAGPTSVLDPTFGDGGVVLSLLPKPRAQANALLVAADGSLYALGFQRDTSTDLVALHYGPNGAPDPSFADGGLLSVPLASTAGATAALLQPDGSIVIASDDANVARVVRVLPGGALDTSFATAAFATSTRALAIARDPATGALLVGGSSGTQCLLARLQPGGALDPAFASQGVLAITRGDVCSVAAVGVQDDGRIVVAQTVTTGGASSVVVARYWP